MPEDSFHAARTRLPSRTDAGAVLRALARYALTVIPLARRELSRWRQRAAAIPDDKLREHATGKLRDEPLNAEAAAVFSTLVRVRDVADIVRLTVAFQVLYDYLDAVTEQPVVDPILNGRQLYRSLVVALDTSAARAHYYRHHPQEDDGGYVDELITVCREVLAKLPSAAAIKDATIRAALRCGEAQTRTHAVARLGVAQLADWAAVQDPEGEFLWWELAAGCTAPLSIHALFAAAADPGTTTEDADTTESAYHPAVCALSTLLDSALDYARDAPGIDHRYAAYYQSSSLAAERLAEIAARGSSSVRMLRHGPRHAVIAAGIGAFYLSASAADGAFAAPIKTAVLDALGPVASVPFAVMRARRRI